MTTYRGYTITFPCAVLRKTKYAVIRARQVYIECIPTHNTRWAALRQAVEIIRDMGRSVPGRGKR